MPADAEFGTAPAFRSPRSSGPRVRSLTISLAVHGIAVFVLFSLPAGNTPIFQVPAEEQAFEAKPEHIIWYPLKEIPEISPGDTADTAAISAETPSPEVVIHKAPDAAHDNRLVWRAPERQEPAPQRPAPDMIAVERGADNPSKPQHKPEDASLPPEPVKPAPKAFVAPAAAPPAVKASIKLEEPPPLVDQPKLAVAESSIAELTSGSNVKYIKRFVPPPPNQQTKKGDGAGPSFIPNAPTVQGAGGTSDINALIINTVHGPAIDAGLPRPSAVSTGPVKGGPTQGGGKGDLQIPGVTVRPRAGETEASLKTPKDPFKAPGEGANTPLPFVSTRIAPLEHTLSAPLRPSSRSIPNLIERRFSGRVVYTILLPMKGLPGYTGDWTLWFAERQSPDANSGAPMRAPLPIRKPVRADISAGVTTNESVQLSAIMDKSGKLNSVSVIGGSEAVAATVIADFESWEFLPALRNREPVEIDLIVEIPFGINRQSLPLTRVPVPSSVDSAPPPTHN